MYCPDCGTENTRGQKFCTRCGVNLLALERARDIVSDAGAGEGGSPVDSSTLLKVVAIISIFGFAFVTAGGIILASIEGPQDSPLPFFTIIGGYGAIVLICRFLLQLISVGAKKGGTNRSGSQPAYNAPVAAPGSTQRSLSEGAVPYQSVTEQSTRQFEGKSRGQS